MEDHICVRPADIGDMSAQSLQHKARECAFCAEILISYKFDVPLRVATRSRERHRCLSLSEFKLLTIEQAEKRTGSCDACTFLVDLRKRRGWDDPIDTPKSSDY